MQDKSEGWFSFAFVLRPKCHQVYFTRNIHFLRKASSALWPNPYPFCPVCPPQSRPLFCKRRIFHLPISFPLNVLVYAGKAPRQGHRLSSTRPPVKAPCWLPLHHSNYSLQRSQVNNRFGTADYFVLILHIIQGKKRVKTLIPPSVLCN